MHFYGSLVEGNRCSTAHVFRRRGLVLNCSRDKGVRAVMCTLENGSGAVPSLLVNSDESRQLVIVKLGKHFGLCLRQIIIGSIGLI